MSTEEELFARIQAAKAQQDWQQCIQVSRELIAQTPEARYEVWCSAKMNLAIGLWNLPCRDTVHQEEQLRVHEELLAAAGKREDAELAARQHQHLSLLHGCWLGDSQKKHYQQAIIHSQEALKFYTQDGHPYEWAMNITALGEGYELLGQGKEVSQLEAAISCYSIALSVFTKDEYPEDYADTVEVLIRLNKQLSQLRGGR